MIVSSENSPVRESVVRFANAKSQLSFDGADDEADSVYLSATEADDEDEDSKVEKCQVDVDHSDNAYLSNNLSGLSTRTWEERESVEDGESLPDDNDRDGKSEREGPPIAREASDALGKIREMRQILEADPNLKETIRATESNISSTAVKIEGRTSSNALDALRAVRMQLEANKDVAKAVSDTMHAAPRTGLPPRSPSKGKVPVGRFFIKNPPANAAEKSVASVESSSQAPRDAGLKSDVEERSAQDIRVASRSGLPPRLPVKGKLSEEKSFTECIPERAPDAFMVPSLSSSSQASLVEKSGQKWDDVEEGDVPEDSSVASLTGPPPPPPPPPAKMKRSEGSRLENSTRASAPDGVLVPTVDEAPQTSRDQHEKSDDTEERSVHDPNAESESGPPRPHVRGKLSMGRFFKKSARTSVDGDSAEHPESSSNLDEGDKNSEDAEDVQDPCVEVVLKGYVPGETDESKHSKSRRRVVRKFFNVLGRKNRKETPDLSPDNLEEGEEREGEDAGKGEHSEKGENFPRVFSSESYVEEGIVNRNPRMVDEVEDDMTAGAAASSGFCCAAGVDSTEDAEEVPSQTTYTADNAAAISPEHRSVDGADADLFNAIDFEAQRFKADIDVKDIERKMKQKRATDASVSSLRGPVPLAGTAGKKGGNLSSAASVKSSRTNKSSKSSRNRPSHNIKQKKPAIYHSGKLAGSAGTAQRGDQRKFRDDNNSYTRWPQDSTTQTKDAMSMKFRK